MEYPNKIRKLNNLSKKFITNEEEEKIRESKRERDRLIKLERDRKFREKLKREKREEHEKREREIREWEQKEQERKRKEKERLELLKKDPEVLDKIIEFCKIFDRETRKCAEEDKKEFYIVPAIHYKKNEGKKDEKHFQLLKDATFGFRTYLKDKNWRVYCGDHTAPFYGAMFGDEMTEHDRNKMVYYVKAVKIPT